MAKRIFDLVLAFVLVVLLGMPMLIIAAFIKIVSKAPAIFWSTRVGVNNAILTMAKFRTMQLDAPQAATHLMEKPEKYFIAGARFLRKYSFDELPQLFNVLKGDMSFVGPRPLYISQIAEWNDREKKRLLVKPGLTGLAQISGRGSLTREKKLELDVTYVESAGIWMDLKIIFATCLMIFGKKNIYEKKYSTTEDTRGDVGE